MLLKIKIFAVFYLANYLNIQRNNVNINDIYIFCIFVKMKQNSKSI